LLLLVSVFELSGGFEGFETLAFMLFIFSTGAALILTICESAYMVSHQVLILLIGAQINKFYNNHLDYALLIDDAKVDRSTTIFAVFTGVLKIMINATFEAKKSLFFSSWLVC
jgi:hypothetical protein